MAVHATFGTTEYIEPNIIHIPMTFSQNICAIECSDFSITGIDALESLHVSGEGSEFSLHISPAIGLVGVMFVEIKGSVYLLGNDPERVFSPIRSVRYDSREIYVTGKQLPPSILPGLQSAYFDLNREVSGVNPHAILISGVDVGQPKIYSAPTPDNDLISGLRPLDAEYVEYNNSDSPRRYFRLDFEFPEPPPIGNLNIDIKDGSVIGYVDPYVAPEIPEMNLSFSGAIPFNQSYKLAASEVIETYDADDNPTGFNITGLPAGIDWTFGSGIIRISGTPTSVGTGIATITVGDISVERPWQVFSSARRRRGERSTRQAVPVLSMADATIYLDESFVSPTGIFTGVIPTDVYAEGLLRNWVQARHAPDLIFVEGDAKDVARVESGIWTIVYFYNGGPPEGATQEVNWRVIERPPVISNVDTQKVYLYYEVNIPIPISHKPGGIIVEGLQNRIGYEMTEEGAKVVGIPEFVVEETESRMIKTKASTSGGDDVREFQLIVSDEFPPSMSTVTYDGGRNFSWSAVPGATSYAYNIGFTDVWTDVGNVTEVSIESLMIGQIYGISWRVNSPWMGQLFDTDYIINNLTITAYLGSIDISAQNIPFFVSPDYFGGITFDTLNNEVILCGRLDNTTWYRYRLDGTYLGSVSVNLGGNSGFNFVSGLGFENVNNRVMLTSSLSTQSFRGWLSLETDGSYVDRYGVPNGGIGGITHDYGGNRILLATARDYKIFDDQTYVRATDFSRSYHADNIYGSGLAYIVGSEGPVVVVANYQRGFTNSPRLFVYNSVFNELLTRIEIPSEISSPALLDIAADEVNNEVLVLDGRNQQWHRFII